MRQINFYFLLFIFSSISFVSNAQNDSSTINFSIIDIPDNQPNWSFTDTSIQYLNKNNNFTKWKQIEILDQLYPKYLNRYTLISKKRQIQILDSTDTKIKSISKRKINKLLSKLVEQIKYSDSMYLNYHRNSYNLEQFNLDSIWYKKEISKIWNEYRLKNNITLDNIQLNKAESLLLNPSEELKRIIRFPNNWNINESSLIDLKINYGFATIEIQATSYFPFMQPWHYFNNKTILENSNISLLVGDLLILIGIPTDNISRVKGQNFNLLLMDDIYNRYLKNKIN